MPRKKQVKKGGSMIETKPLREYQKLLPKELKASGLGDGRKLPKLNGDGIGDIAQKAIEKSGLEAHMIASIIPPKRMSFCGPGTRLDKRLNPDGSWKPWSEPYEWSKYGPNSLDFGCLRHDLSYLSSGDPVKDNETRRKADKELVEHAKRWRQIKEANNDMGVLDKVNYQLVDKIIGSMSGSGLVIPDLNRKLKLIN